ncbi:MAG: hypothetical protein A2315_15250 [Ignavibacteria bacterium RIFOXYB2_FULL_35_12]|nr:MAG: hypothetical protein A2058_08875 [Ignavibacteria bacterium GWA2_36_19]OGU62389.1 MAG: hypothetical protein A2X60_13900 [Ignavibacteria bacterium GWF2_35_20]OGU79234.1 MAG: hypothetical protein A2254_07690 [Ignavibacteria bacterium RIFOXYA2_FULL_35_9]OGU86294.1 MAG: hypothetical protein A3K31_02340 [Ignavibacteria bacterium RIFOXYA12_FULL_35_25]OGU86404.1 MAG: hypothetical protein A2492_04965 [Ignavibacteria bacterium RIFOXYC12_FULL_35_11]OGU97608.1 MAG: hypothetical protein A2347_09115
MEIFLDENLSEYVADAFNSLNKGYFRDVQVFSTKVKFGKGAPDEEIIPEIGQISGILVTQDVNIHRMKLQYNLCSKFNLGIFFLALPKDQNKHWEIVKLLVNNWKEIIHRSEKEKKPFAFRIRVRGKMEKL